ncbi:hypothetical protein TNCV_192241 [Trichonephila clavipes]|nr:hypothetical protein TNCV_192241 [Trichonephila clavipes]
MCLAGIRGFQEEGSVRNDEFAGHTRSVITDENISQIHDDNESPHVAKTVQGFCLAQHMQLLQAYSPDILPIEHMWDLVGWRLARDPCLTALKD